MGINLHDLGLGIRFLNMTADAQAQKSFIKIKNVCVSKDTIKEMKREPTEWEEILCKSYILKD